MFVLWLFILLFVLLWKQKQEKQIICKKPIPSTPPSYQLPWEITEPPFDNTIIDDEMNGGTVIMKVGEKRKVLLSGNATTGYAWRIVKMEGNSVKTDTKWRYKIKLPFLIGSGGYFQREFEAVEPGMTDVYFIYDQVSEPIPMNYSFYLRFDVRL